jgi:DNA-binding response OmpR family regulator
MTYSTTVTTCYYIADDEINICNIIKSFLVKAGFEVEIFKDGHSLLEAFNERQADRLVIDIMMPEIDEYTLCSLIRSKSSVPIIIVSAKDRSTDKIAGLTLGGDDYLVELGVMKRNFVVPLLIYSKGFTKEKKEILDWVYL